MATTTYAILALVPVLAWYFYTWRFKKDGHIPHQFPKGIFGHIPLMTAGFKKFGDTRRHAGKLVEASTPIRG
jgi:hypothetical protein